MSNTNLLLKAHTTPQKMSLIKSLTDEEKLGIVTDLKEKIIAKWDGCGIETTNRLEKTFDKQEDQILYLDSLFSFSEWTFNKYTYGNRTQKNIFQWDIYYCDLGHNIGNEKNKTRPVIIIQKTKGYLEANTLIVAPITIGEDFTNLYDHEVLIDHTFRGKIKGKIDLSHLKSVDRSRLDERFTDRLLNKGEYASLYKGNPFTSIQDKINNSLKKLLTIS